MWTSTRTKHFFLVSFEGLQLVRQVPHVEQLQRAVARRGEQPVGALRVPPQVLTRGLVRVPETTSILVYSTSIQYRYMYSALVQRTAIHMNTIAIH